MRKFAVYGVTLLCCFVFVHNFVPHDPRVHAGFHSFDFNFALTAHDLYLAVIKWKHMLWFAIFFPLVRLLFREPATAKAIAAVFVVSLLIELQQSVINGRHARIADLIPNFIGTLVGAYTWMWAASFIRARGRVS